jgi:hypothetical protein
MPKDAMARSTQLSSPAPSTRLGSRLSCHLNCGEEPSARARFRSLQQMIPRRTHPLLICLYELRARIAIGRAGCSIIDKSKLEVEQIDSGEVGLDNPPIRAVDELLLDEGDE